MYLPFPADLPRIRPQDERDDETLDADVAEDILEYLSTDQCAPRKHAVFALLWETGVRIGAANSPDVEDVDTDEERINLIHRPEQGTQLKNGTNGEDQLQFRANRHGRLKTTER